MKYKDTGVKFQSMFLFPISHQLLVKEKKKTVAFKDFTTHKLQKCHHELCCRAIYKHYLEKVVKVLISPVRSCGYHIPCDRMSWEEHFPSIVSAPQIYNPNIIIRKKAQIGIHATKYITSSQTCQSYDKQGKTMRNCQRPEDTKETWKLHTILDGILEQKKFIEEKLVKCE